MTTVDDRPLDPRVERTRRVVIEATASLLTDEGFGRVTIDAIAEASGVARSTIYRNWPDRADLLVDAFTEVCAIGPTPTSGRIADDFRAKARQLVHGLHHEAWGRILPSIVAAAAHDDEVREALVRFNEERRTEAVAMVERAVEQGQLAAPDDARRPLERFISGFFFRYLFAHAALDDEFVEDQVRRLCADLGADYEPSTDS